MNHGHNEEMSIEGKGNIAEQCLLGALMSDPLSFDKIEQIISEKDFVSKVNAAWFAQIKSMLESGLEVSVLPLVDALSRVNPRYNWMVYIGDAMYHSPSAANIKHYAQVVADYAHERKTIEASAKIGETLSNSNLAHSERVSISESLLNEIVRADNSIKTSFTIGEALSSAVETIERKYGSEGDIVEFSYGIDKLDEMTIGAHRGDLIYIAGRPSMGKTALAMNFGESFCRDGMVGLIQSMEMSAEQLAGRLITSVGQIDAQSYRTGKLVDDDWSKLTHALGRLNQFKLRIDESSVVTPSIIRRNAKAAIKEFGKLDFIMIDYLQLMNADTPTFGSNRVGEITEISRNLKRIAKEFNVPVIVLSQLNRNLEQRPNKRPVMSDLRESGAIEQDGDVIMFIYRDEIYNKDSDAKGVAEIIIGKQRNGPIGTVFSAFIGAYSKFANLTGFEMANKHND